jgi:hypothetical protein
MKISKEESKNQHNFLFERDVLFLFSNLLQVFENVGRSVLSESNMSSPPKQTDAASLELIKQRLERLKR